MSQGETKEIRESIKDPQKDNGENIQLYHYVQSSWRPTTKLTSSDIAVIIDPSQTQIFVWEGRRDLPRVREQAKSALLSLKLQYPRYSFSPIPHSKSFRRLKKQQKIPEPILNTLQYAFKS
jgi:hypothetical protein